MKLKAFEGKNKSELSMIEVAHEIMEESGKTMYFSDLVNEIQTYLEKSDVEIRTILPQFYTDLNIDGSFISLGDNQWGLRSWYPIDSIDEEVNHSDEDEEDTPRRKKRKKVNAFIGVEDEGIIDYNDDDPEDEDLNNTDNDDDYVDPEEEEEEEEELVAYDNDLSEIGADDDPEDELPDGVEGSLGIIDEEDLEEDDFDSEEEEEV